LDFSELPILLCGFFVGPSGAVACEGVKVLLNLLFDGTTTAFVGEFANFAVGCALVIPASVCYRYLRTRKGALLSCLLGTVCITVLGSAFNAFYLLPKFADLYGIPLPAIIGMGTAINSSVTSVGTLVMFCVVPFNLLKGVLVSVITYLLYKRVEKLLLDRHH
jgi:riboflavin transporter FmnP